MDGMTAYEMAVKAWLDVTATEDAELNAVYDGSEAQVKKCFAYIEKEVRKLAGGKSCYVATDEEVFSLARKYIVEVYENEMKEEAERKAKAEANRKAGEEARAKAKAKAEEDKKKKEEVKAGVLSFDFAEPSAPAEAKKDEPEAEEAVDNEDDDSCDEEPEQEEQEEELEIF